MRPIHHSSSRPNGDCHNFLPIGGGRIPFAYSDSEKIALNGSALLDEPVAPRIQSVIVS